MDNENLTDNLMMFALFQEVVDIFQGLMVKLNNNQPGFVCLSLPMNNKN